MRNYVDAADIWFIQAMLGHAELSTTHDRGIATLTV